MQRTKIPQMHTNADFFTFLELACHIDRCIIFFCLFVFICFITRIKGNTHNFLFGLIYQNFPFHNFWIVNTTRLYSGSCFLLKVLWGGSLKKLFFGDSLMEIIFTPHTITHWKHTTQWFSVYSKLYKHHNNFRIFFITGKRNPVPSSSHYTISHLFSHKQPWIFCIYKFVYSKYFN